MEAEARHRAFLTRLQKWELDALRGAAEQVGDLVEHPGWGVVQALVQTAKDADLRLMLYPVKPLEQAEYARLSGLIEGLERGAAAAEAVLIAEQRAQAKATARVEAQEATA